jgi:nicotinamide-nucleotide amidase
VTARAAVLVTGTEVLTGRVADRNGPWMAEQLRVHGVDIASVTVVGDRPDDLRTALRVLTGSGVDVVFTSGGLGPTADDLTAEIVAEVQGRPLRFDPGVHETVAAIVARLNATRGWHLDPAATDAATRKQAMVPVGGTALAPVGTAPGLIVPVAEGRAGPPVIVLPGPPRELQGMWDAALASPLVAAALANREEVRQRTLRLWGTPESELAAVLRRLGRALDPLEITTCLRLGGELEIVSRFPPDAQAAYDQFAAAIGESFPATLFSPDGRTIDDIVADLLLAGHLTIATTESCTAGLLAGRIADRPGSSEYLLGGLVTYSNEAKSALADVPASLIARVGAVSAEVAQAMAAGARKKLGTDLGVGITGIAGPGGGTPDKPVGLVYLHVSGPDGAERARRAVFPGSRADVRAGAVYLALQMVRQVLQAR